MAKRSSKQMQFLNAKILFVDRFSFLLLPTETYEKIPPLKKKRKKIGSQISDKPCLTYISFLLHLSFLLHHTISLADNFLINNIWVALGTLSCYNRIKSAKAGFLMASKTLKMMNISE